MKRETQLGAALFAILLAAPSVAAANPEPSPYDARSVGLGLTGATYLDRPAAIAINPANLQGTETFDFTLTLNPIWVKQTAPLEGPEFETEAELGFGPLGALFGTARVTDDLVLGAGIYIMTGYGSAFRGIEQLDGVMLDEPADLTVTFFVVEAALAASYRVLPNLDVGVALRFPYARQDADVVQELFPGALSPVRQEVDGFGYPAGRVGITYRPVPELRLAFVYRSKARIPMSGRTITTLGALELDPLPTSTDWFTPHALHLGASLSLLDDRFLGVLEYRIQFHEEANPNQVFDVEGFGEIDVPFLWRNVHSGRLGAEYWVHDVFALRFGYNLALSATRGAGAQNFTPPPGIQHGVYGGFGFRFDHVDVDLATLYAFGDEFVEDHPEFCAPGERVKTGCAGRYSVKSYWLSFSLTYRL